MVRIWTVFGAKARKSPEDSGTVAFAYGEIVRLSRGLGIGGAGYETTIV
jgi:hypothetical protein